MMHEVTSNKRGIAILSLRKVEEYKHTPLRDTVHLLRIFMATVQFKDPRNQNFCPYMLDLRSCATILLKVDKVN